MCAYACAHLSACDYHVHYVSYNLDDQWIDCGVWFLFGKVFIEIDINAPEYGFYKFNKINSFLFIDAMSRMRYSKQNKKKTYIYMN